MKNFMTEVEFKDTLYRLEVPKPVIEMIIAMQTGNVLSLQFDYDPTLSLDIKARSYRYYDERKIKVYITKGTLTIEPRNFYSDEYDPRVYAFEIIFTEEYPNDVKYYIERVE